MLKNLANFLDHLKKTCDYYLYNSQCVRVCLSNYGPQIILR